MSQQPRIIKKYPNRRLYDTETSSYITLQDVKKLVLEHVDFRVEDAKSKDDLTRSILLQIILDEETAGAPMFSSDMLSQIIRFYGNAMQGMMGTYLEKNIHTFMDIQKRLQDQSRQIYGQNPMLSSDAWSGVREDAGAGDPGPDEPLSRAERERVHGHAAAAPAADAQSLRELPVPELRRAAGQTSVRQRQRRRRDEELSAPRSSRDAVRRQSPFACTHRA